MITIEEIHAQILHEWEKAELECKDFKEKNKDLEENYMYGFNRGLHVGKCNTLRDINKLIYQIINTL